MKGWYGDKQRHSMASRGVRTGDKKNKPKNMNNKRNTYMLEWFYAGEPPEGGFNDNFYCKNELHYTIQGKPHYSTFCFLKFNADSEEEAKMIALNEDAEWGNVGIGLYKLTGDNKNLSAKELYDNFHYKNPEYEKILETTEASDEEWKKWEKRDIDKNKRRDLYV